MDKRRYFTRKIVNVILTLIAVASFNFFLFRILPGDPTRILLPKGRFGAEAIARERQAFHLDKPRWEQFIYYWKDTAELNFGYSFAESRPVTQVVADAFWPTMILCGLGTLLATIVGMVEGVIAGWKRGKAFDVTSTNVSMVMYAMPTFWQCLLAVMLFAIALRWLPTGRMYDPDAHFAIWGPFPLDWASFKTMAYHISLPVTLFALGYYGEYHLIMRSSLTGVMKEDYVLTAQAKGLRENGVLWRHVVPNALLPTVSLVMMNLGFIVSGAILVESVFNWPGVGLLAYESMENRDYPVMQAVFLLASVAVVIANFIADIMMYYIDPRVKA